MKEETKPGLSRMPRKDRAKQFAPFAALKGFEAALIKKELEAEKAADRSVYVEEEEPC